MRHQDRRADPVEQCDRGVAVDRLAHLGVADHGQRLRHELIEDRIADRAAARPLRVQFRLREKIVFLVGDEIALDRFRRSHRLRPIDRLDIGRAAAADLVHDVDRIALGEEILAPAVAAVGRAHVARAREAAALDHHDRVGMRAVGRDVVFDIGLAGEHRAVFGVHIFAADEEMAGLGDRQGADAVRARGVSIAPAQARMRKAAARRLIRVGKPGIERNLPDIVCISSLPVPSFEEV